MAGLTACDRCAIRIARTWAAKCVPRGIARATRSLRPYLSWWNPDWLSEYSLRYTGPMSTRAPAMRAEERRAAIIAATLPLLLERGTNISTRQIAETAGIAEGTIF